MSENDVVRPYIDAAARTIKRSRDVAILILIPAALAFSGYWNTRATAWSAQRVRRLTEITRELQANPSRSAKSGYTLPEAQMLLEQLRKQQIEQSSVKVPLVNTSVDINDVGLFAGATFLILMLWLRKALWHERWTVMNAFHIARAASQLSFAYDILATHQVLASAPSVSGGVQRKPPVNPARGLVILPVLIHAMITAQQSLVNSIARSLYGATAIFGLFATIVFLLAIAATTLSCWMLLRQIDKMWRQAAADIVGSDQVQASHPAPAEVINEEPHTETPSGAG